MVLREETLIRTTPERVMEFFHGMARNYTRWHPDHHRFDWVEGDRMVKGAVAEFEGTIAGRRRSMKVVYTRVEPGRLVESAPQPRLFRLLLPRILFRIEPAQGEVEAGDAGGGCRVVQEIHIRMGPLGSRLNRKELDAVRRHMKEEGDKGLSDLSRKIKRYGGWPSAPPSPTRAARTRPLPAAAPHRAVARTGPRCTRSAIRSLRG